ncbi:enoyl-CoA hydratase/isomerase family protein [Dietzia sp. SL131]|uniref:enoyl-CoA hydratase/isomerase family protein n=1 Tax=Dietzia sp. SL131 TaxID=2995149 RepID=UPI00227B1237|nr:enoyl-CoA hydratase/isomerase family protein [Dietzia sp. SL131]MCY1659188.1 enoyl-CoA hydratase/isomerase family protein [Dietzia sp. SL131]
MTPTLTHHEDIAVLTLGDDENRFTPDRLDAINAHLDEVEQSAKGLVTVGSGKFYSNGLDLDWLMANSDRLDWYVGRIHELFSRVLTFSLPTVAAVNGHAFGGGAMLATAHDFRVMRDDRGYFCFPEVDINIPFTPGMAALIQAKTTPQTAMTAMSTGHRYPGSEAKEAGLVDDTAAEAEIVTAALGRLQPILGKDRTTLDAIKSTMFASVTEALRQSPEGEAG